MKKLKFSKFTSSHRLQKTLESTQVNSKHSAIERSRDPARKNAIFFEIHQVVSEIHRFEISGFSDFFSKSSTRICCGTFDPTIMYTMKPRRNDRNQRRAMIFCLGISFIATSVGNNATWSSTHPKYLQFSCIIRVCKRARYKALLEPQKVTGISCDVCLKKSWQSLPIGHPIISGLQRAPI